MNADRQDPHPLYTLLPAVFRNRDLARGGSLQALFDVLGSQSQLVDDNIQQLYDDQFIETCAPWVIPYIGELIGFNSLYTAGLDGLDSRAEVANTIGYRRRKGTLLALEQVATDVTGGAVVAVEEFRHVITTLSLRDVRRHHYTTANLRSRHPLEGPFERRSHTVDIRRIAPRQRPAQEPDQTPLDVDLHGGGRYSVPNVALWMWRWRSFPVVGMPATQVSSRRFLFNPLGAELPLFQHPAARVAFDRLSTERDVPQPILRADFKRHRAEFYPSALQVRINDVAVPVTHIWPSNLSCQPDPPIPAGMVAIDPETGRLELAADMLLPDTVTVDYAYGFPGEMGGGPYDRASRLPAPVPVMATWTAIVGSVEFPTLLSAVQAWNAEPAGRTGRIIVPGYGPLQEDLTGANAIQLPPESSLLLVAADLLPNPPFDPIPEWTDAFPTLTGDIEVNATAAPPLADGGDAPLSQCTVSGLRIAGQIRIVGDALSLQIQDTTLVPGLAMTTCGEEISQGEPSLLCGAPGTCVCVDHAITGPIAMDAASSLRLSDSIIDAGSPCCPAIVAPDLVSAGPSLRIEESTVIGKVHVHSIPLASNSIFHARTHRHDGWKAPVWSTRRQTGCVRFCSLPFESLVPRRFRCLPRDSAVGDLLAPHFITLRYGKPGYCLLSGSTPMAVWTGADDGSQMGAWHQLAETEAVRNLQIRAPEFLPANMESGIFLVPSRPAKEGHHALPYGRIAAPCGCDEDTDAMPSGIGIALL